MDIELLSFIVSLIPLLISLVTFVRSRKAQELAKLHAEFVISPKLTLSDMELYIFDGKDDKPAFEFSEKLNCYSSSATKIIGIYIEYGDEVDSAKKNKQELIGPNFYF